MRAIATKQPTRYASFIALTTALALSTVPYVIAAETERGTISNRRRANTNTNAASIAHIISPYGVSKCDPEFCPFEQDQSVALASMIRAKEKAHTSVILATSTLPEEGPFIPPEFIQLPFLTRSAASEYPELGKRRLPFVQDMIDSLFASGIEFEYMIYTNADIILHEEFYNIVQQKIDEGLDVFTINRLTVSKTRADGSLFTKDDLDQIFELEGGQHPGSDCFVIKRHFLERIQMGNAFLGFPPWGNSLLKQLHFDNAVMETFGSHKLNATFHLGNDNDWKDPSHNAYKQQNTKNVFESKRLWCMCEMSRLKDPGACGMIYLQYYKLGYDVSQACPEIHLIMSEIYGQLSH